MADEDFVDITLTADGGALKAHKVILSACSPYFRDILRGISAWQHPVIVLKDVPYPHLQGIVEYIYHGEVNEFLQSVVIVVCRPKRLVTGRRVILEFLNSWIFPLFIVHSLNFQVSVEYDNLTGFLKTAQYLRVKGLTEEASANATTTPGMTVNAIFHKAFLSIMYPDQ